MDMFDATMIAEGCPELTSTPEPTEEQVLEAWQYLVDTGAAWQLQGFFGRTAQALIDGGYINAADAKTS